MAQKRMIPLRDYLTAKASIYQRKWAVTPWQIIFWGLRQLGLGHGPPDEEDLSMGQFVLLENVEVNSAAASDPAVISPAHT